MNKKFSKLIHVFLVTVFSVTATSAQEHPSLVLTQDGVKSIRENLGSIPVFDKSLSVVKEEVDQEIASGIHVPVPKDMAGGYTHDRHKKNWFVLQKAGALYQILNDEKYAKYVHDVLKAYAEMYPSLPLHPQERSYARGKIFWQCLNDANWLVYVSQAYDCIYNYLSEQEREHLERNLFIPYADFLSIETPQFFNRVHNHSTWGNVAVGMIGLAMNNDELVERALEGLNIDNLDPNAKDNDGGFIKNKDGKAGFLANLDEPFSPDGYYTEGPYYQRYAMYPFMVFAEALQNARPDLNIMNYKGGVLLKAVYALLNLTNEKGEFFPLNDGQKGMSYLSHELVAAVDIAYHFGGNDNSLLEIANKQNKVLLDDTGLAVALALQQDKAQKFSKKSVLLRDGSDGSEGAVAILRSKDEQFGLVMKNTAQGLSHGHYDKLSFSYYNGADEVLQDYGLARFVNIEQKNGGGYLKENKTWAKQTIAHNTVVQDEVSHFSGQYNIGSKHHSDVYLFNCENSNLQVVSAKEENAYPGTTMERTMFLFEDDEFENPILLDVFRLNAERKHQYDLPFYYHNQIINTNFDYEQESNMTPLGLSNGYQHLWLEAKTNLNTDQTTQVTWRDHNRFYTLSSALQKGDQFLFTRIGANDPKFNLRRDPAFILRKKNIQNTTFINVIETHGSYDVVSESATDAYSQIKNITEYNVGSTEYVALNIETKSGNIHNFIVCLNNSNPTKKHHLELNGETIEWKGAFSHKKTR